MSIQNINPTPQTPYQLSPNVLSTNEETDVESVKILCSRYAGEPSGHQDPFAQYMHSVAASALEKISSMESQGFSAKQILCEVNSSWPEFQTSRRQLAQSVETFAANQREIKQSRVSIDRRSR